MQIGAELPEMHNTSCELHNAFVDVVKVRFVEIKYMEYLFNDVLEIKNGKNQKLVENPEGLYPIYGSGGIIGYADKYICEANTVIIGRKGSINNPIYVSEPFWNVDTAFGLSPKQDILLPRYLFYFCKNYNFEKLNKTVTIPSLTKADLLKIQIDLPSIDEQRRIVDKLIKVETIINLRNYQVQQLDDLIKARFVEMFGDNQEVHKLSDIAAITGGLTKNSRRDKLELRKPYLRVANVFFASIDTTEILDIGLTKEEYEKTLLRNGDLLFVEGNGSPDQIGRVAIWNGEIEDCVHQNHLIKARFDLKRMNPVFAMYYFISERGRNQIKKRAVSTSGLYTLSVSKIADFEIPNPPMELQQQFADFVTQIDKSKATVQKALDETQLLFDSLMQQYFG